MCSRPLLVTSRINIEKLRIGNHRELFEIFQQEVSQIVPTKLSMFGVSWYCFWMFLHGLSMRAWCLTWLYVCCKPWLSHPFAPSKSNSRTFITVRIADAPYAPKAMLEKWSLSASLMSLMLWAVCSDERMPIHLIACLLQPNGSRTRLPLSKAMPESWSSNASLMSLMLWDKGERQ